MKVSTRERRLLLGAGVAAVLVAAVVHGVAPFVAAELGVREQIEERRALLARSRRAAAGKEGYERQASGLRARLHRAEELLFRGEKPALTAAELQELLHGIARDAGVTAVRENVPPARVSGAFTEVAVELSLRGDLKAVRDFLFRVQTAPRLLTVPKLVLRGHPAPGVVTVTADVQVSGYMLGAATRE